MFLFRVPVYYFKVIDYASRSLSRSVNLASRFNLLLDFVCIQELIPQTILVEFLVSWALSATDPCPAEASNYLPTSRTRPFLIACACRSPLFLIGPFLVVFPT